MSQFLGGLEQCFWTKKHLFFCKHQKNHEGWKRWQNYFQKALREIFKHFRLDDLSECLIEVDGRATFILWLAEDTGWLGGCGRLTNSLPGGIEAQKRLHVWFLVLPAHIFHIRPFHEVDPSSARAVKIVLGYAKIQQRKTGANKTFNTFRPVSLVST